MLKASGRFGGHVLLLLVELMAGLLAGVVVLGALLAWRLSEGPLNVAAMTPYMLTALNESVAPFKVEIDSTALTWSQGRPTPVLEARNMRILNPQGRVTAQVPKVQVGLSLPALVLGRPAPSQITLVGAHLVALRLGDGQVRFSLAPEGEAALAEPSGTGDADFLNQWLATMARPPRSTSLLGALRHIEVSAASLEMIDYQMGVRWRVPRFDVRLNRDDDGVEGAARIEMMLGEQSSVISADLSYNPGLSELSFVANLDHFNPADLSRWAPSFADLAPYNVPLGGHFEGRWAPAVGIKSFGFDFTAGSGEVPGFEPDSQIKLNFVKLSGAVDRMARTASLKELEIDFGGSRLHMLAEAKRVDDRVQVEVSARAQNLHAEEMARYWPAGISRNARSWIAKNIEAGQVTEGSVTAVMFFPLDRLRRPVVQEVDGRLKLEGLTVNYLRPLPPAINARGFAYFDQNSFNIDIHGAEVAGVDGVQILPSTVKLLGLTDDTDRAEIDLNINGPLAAQLAILDNPPLRYPSRLKIEPEKAKGTASTRARFAFPLLHDLPIGQVAISSSAVMQDVALPKLVAGQDLTGGKLELQLDGAGMNITGTGKLGPSDVKFDWREEFLSSQQPNSRIAFSTVLDEEGRQAFHLTWPEVVGEKINVDGTYTKNAGQPAHLDVAADLTPTRLSLPWFGWSKPAGKKASGEAKVVIDKQEVTEVSSFRIKGAEISTNGKVSFGENSRWDTVTLASLSIPGTDLKGSITNRGSDGPLMKLAGPSVDVRAIFGPEDNEVEASAATVANAEPEPITPFDISFTFDRAVTGEGKVLQQARGRVARTTEDWSYVEVEGLAGDRRVPVLARLVPTATGRSLVLRSEDAGAMLGTLRLMSSIRGGKINVEASGVGAEPVQGVADLRDFIYLQPRTLKKLAAAAEPEGSKQVEQQDELKFERLKVRLAYDNYALNLKDGRLAGNLIGMTGEGNIDLRRGQIDLQGTFVPLYGVNTMVSGIPILGWILTGGEGQGIFAVTYTIKGALRNPETSVNPLSVLTPGFLRNIFFQGKD